MNILASASKLVFLVMTLALCLFTWFWIVEAKDFVMLVGMVFSYYFAKNQTAETQAKTPEN